MHTNRRYVAFASVLVFAVMAFMSLAAYAQVTSATLTGTVYDSSGAVVPSANVSLKNEASGDTRRTVSNGEGYFTFGAVPPGTYTVAVESKGFNNWEAKGVVLESGDKRTVSGIKMVPGAATETVSVEATAAQITPVDSGEKSTTINQHILQNVAIVGQNAAEFIKIMPGMAYTAGALNQASYAASDERTGTGPVGSFSANGQRTAALDITSDGAHIIDPGCNCGQAMNTNVDMTQELKVMTSNFGADEAKGPVVIQAISKSGGQQFHGEGYLYSRYFLFNANDSINKAAGRNPLGQEIAPRPEATYFYPGAQIDGPVIIPHSDFNHNKDKLFFFFGVQAYRQNVDYGVFHAVVPTKAERNGDFSALSSHPQNSQGCPDTSTYPAGQAPKNYPYENCYTNDLAGSSINAIPHQNGWTANGLWASPGTPFDPTGTGPGLVSTYPLDNADPYLNHGFNYINATTRFSNMIQYRGRVDYSINDSTKLYVSYNHQNDNAINSLDTLWTGYAQSWASPTTPYPSPLVETTQSDVVTANLTKLFSPTLTNELLFTYTYLNLPNSFADPTKVQRGSLGINYQMYFNHGDNSKIIFPQLTGWGDGISNQLNTGFELNNTVYAKKTLPSVADNVFKVWGTHTTKFGFYWERTWNSQPGNANVNGTAIFSNWGSNSSGNAYADMLMGQTTQYSETNYDVVPAFRYLSEEFYGQDSWKVSRRLTLDYGLRVSHLGPWVDTTGYGFAAWYPNLYAQGKGATITPTGTNTPLTFPGIEWNKANSSTPLSGSGSRTFFYNPRVGFAWDLFGTGKTVLRGGYGMYHFHDEQNVQNGAYGVVRGSFSTPTAWSPTFASLKTVNSLPIPSGITALDPNDTQEPRTQSYSFTVAQRLPWKSVLEVAYVGNKSDYLSNYNNNFDQINDLHIGSMFNAAVCNGGGGGGADPNTNNGVGTTVCGWLPNCNPNINSFSGWPSPACTGPQNNYTTGYSSAQIQAARPLSYGSVKIIDHKMYSNYNSLQVTWNKQAGHLTFLANYTFSKALGIRGEDGSATGDPLNLRDNYGTLPNDRTNIFNVAYVYELPTMHSGNSFVKGAVNGWQLSGIVQYQTGADLQAAVTSNFNYSTYLPAGTTFDGVTEQYAIQASNQNVLGTSDITLMPKVTGCNPGKGLAKNQYVNGACFAAVPQVGQQGTYVFPTMHGPGFFNTDLSVFKNFTWGASETKKLQFRFSGYNFLNHPVNTFINGDPNLNLTFTPDNTGTQITLNNPKFGYTDYRTGHRIMQGMVRFSW